MEVIRALFIGGLWDGQIKDVYYLNTIRVPDTFDPPKKASLWDMTKIALKKKWKYIYYLCHAIVGHSRKFEIYVMESLIKNYKRSS